MRVLTPPFSRFVAPLLILFSAVIATPSFAQENDGPGEVIIPDAPDSYAQPTPAPENQEPQNPSNISPQPAPSPGVVVMNPKQDQTQPSYQDVTYRRVGLIVTGALMFAVPYLLTSGLEIENDFARVGNNFFIPVIGPLLEGIERGDRDFGAIFYLTAAVEAAGLALLTIGLIPKTKRVLVSSQSFVVAPTISPTHAGLMMRMRY